MKNCYVETNLQLPVRDLSITEEYILRCRRANNVFGVNRGLISERKIRKTSYVYICIKKE